MKTLLLKNSVRKTKSGSYNTYSNDQVLNVFVYWVCFAPKFTFIVSVSRCFGDITVK